MRFQDLLKKYTLTQIIELLEYRNIFNINKDITTKNCIMTIDILKRLDVIKNDKITTIDIIGDIKNINKNSYKISHYINNKNKCIEYDVLDNLNLSEWLYEKIDNNDLKKYGEKDILTIFIFEIVHYIFIQYEIDKKGEKRLDSLIRRIFPSININNLKTDDDLNEEDNNYKEDDDPTLEELLEQDKEIYKDVEMISGENYPQYDGIDCGSPENLKSDLTKISNYSIIEKNNKQKIKKFNALYEEWENPSKDKIEEQIKIMMEFYNDNVTSCVSYISYLFFKNNKELLNYISYQNCKTNIYLARDQRIFSKKDNFFKYVYNLQFKSIPLIRKQLEKISKDNTVDKIINEQATSLVIMLSLKKTINYNIN